MLWLLIWTIASFFIKLCTYLTMISSSLSDEEYITIEASLLNLVDVGDRTSDEVGRSKSSKHSLLLTHILMLNKMLDIDFIYFQKKSEIAFEKNVKIWFHLISSREYNRIRTYTYSKFKTNFVPRIFSLKNLCKYFSVIRNFVFRIDFLLPLTINPIQSFSKNSKKTIS